MVRRAAGRKAGLDLHMTGIPAHPLTNQGSRRAHDRWLLWPIAERNSPREAGQGWARLTGREGEGGRARGGQAA